MTLLPRAVRHLAPLLPLVLLASPVPAQDGSAPPAPKSLQTGEQTPWIYRGSDVPRDKEWQFGEMPNGLRYAVRHNGVPPGQVSIRVRIDAGSIHETDSEQGFAHLIEHMTFRESKYLADGAAIATFQRLGATFGSDTNAETTPTQTVYKLDVPDATPAKLEEVFKLLSGMIEAPALSAKGLSEDRPIVLAEMRERAAAAQRVAEESRKTIFAGQRLANRLPIGTEATLNAATPAAVKAFHKRWYRPENAVVVVAGDSDARTLAGLVEKYFGGWKGVGPHTPAPDFGDPKAPAGADPANPVGETQVLVEPDLPRSLTYAVMRPWRPVNDTIKYNEGLLLDSLAQSIINRRLESRARTGGSYLYAQVNQEDVSRTADATFVTFAPLTEDWSAALSDVRAVIADALANPPTQEEIDREMAEFDVAFASSVEQRAVLAGSKLADDVVQAVDIRETVAAPETVLTVFRGMKDQFTPANVLAHTRSLMTGDVIRSVYVTPDASEATPAALRAALLAPVEADGSARVAAKSISFTDLPPLGTPQQPSSTAPLGLLDIQRVAFPNGTTALLWSNNGEPGRVTVKARFGAGWRSFAPEDAVYAKLGESALVSSGLGELGQEELDRISNGRKMGFDFEIDDGVFDFTAQTREADLADQLYLFAAKLATPRWDANPVQRAKAASKLAYESYSTSPSGVLQRDLQYRLYDRDPRFATPTAAQLDSATPAGFRRVWEPLLKQGPVEVLIFGDFKMADAVAALSRTFGALPPRAAIPAATLARSVTVASSAQPEVLFHRGDSNQAAAVIAWPTGGGVASLPESRQLQILTELFNNRLLEEMRERTGASYSPQVSSDWPVDIATGGTVSAAATVRPQDVPAFFAATDQIARDLVANPPTADELARVTEPLKQSISRASTGNTFWLWQLEGASTDPQRVRLLRSLLNDYTQTTPQAMQALAAKYLTGRQPFRLAVIPQGQTLATQVEGQSASVSR
ncbi:insulinase family protein [Altererythrobacter sp. TH136]|uniref:M16 family metallopeptidase n=1 Tax=Altererythrobacter sp. TH136 TaxID=2067415 RepID=UPI00116464DF|nr:insulinase family protein [Altererythrobacter sp. TH136]QDM40219.1 insulinase family protein [Altererythrobacter sp. TH136]